MKNKALIAALILLSLFCHPGIVPAQQENRGASVRFNESGILVEFKTQTEPPQKDSQFEVTGTTSVKGERNITHRVFVDQTSGEIFGYALEVQPSTVANHFMLTIKPLPFEKLDIKSLRAKTVSVKPLPIQGIPVEQLPAETKKRIEQKATTITTNQNPTKIPVSQTIVVSGKNNINDSTPLTRTEAPKYPPAFLIEDGGMFALDVLVNPQTGVKIVDVIKISSGAKQTGSNTAKSQPPRDFSPDAVELSVKNFRFLINEQNVLGAENQVHGGVTGAIIWIYLPGQGRFIFSLKPREGYDFQKIGMIQGNKISYHIGVNRYEWISEIPVFGGGSWNLWVLHDAEYSPRNELFTAGGYQIGAADRIEFLLKKK